MRILIIEDEEAIAGCLSEFLALAGHECRTCLDPEQGVELCRANRYDVVLTDIRMPGLDGLQVLGRIRSCDPAARVILMTGYANVDNAIEAVNRGASAFLRKPLDLREVVATLERIERSLGCRESLLQNESELMRLCAEYRDLERSIRAGA